MNVLLTILVVCCFFGLLYALLIGLLYRRSRQLHKRLNIDFSPFSVVRFVGFYAEILWGVSQIFYWHVFKRRQSPAVFANAEETLPHVLCVHGFHVNGSCFWGLRRFLGQHGYKSTALNLGKPYIDQQKYVDRLTRTIDRLVTESPDININIVAHSMGGLVTRMALQQRPELGAQISRIITLGTPHKGTAVIRKHTITWIKQMFHPDCEFISSLAEFEHISRHCKVLTVASEHDLVVFPATYAHLKQAQQIQLKWVSHVGLITTAHMQQKIHSWLG